MRITIPSPSPSGGVHVGNCSIQQFSHLNLSIECAKREAYSYFSFSPFQKISHYFFNRNAALIFNCTINILTFSPTCHQHLSLPQQDGVCGIGVLHSLQQASCSASHRKKMSSRPHFFLTETKADAMMQYLFLEFTDQLWMILISRICEISYPPSPRGKRKNKNKIRTSVLENTIDVMEALKENPTFLICKGSFKSC